MQWVQWQSAHLAPQTLVSNTSRQYRKQGSSEKWLILGLGQEIYKMSLEDPVVPESKDLKLLREKIVVCYPITRRGH